MWLVENGCPFDPDAAREAVEREMSQRGFFGFFYL